MIAHTTRLRGNDNGVCVSNSLCALSRRVARILAVKLSQERGPHQLAAFRLPALGVDLSALVERMADHLVGQGIQLGMDSGWDCRGLPAKEAVRISLAGAQCIRIPQRDPNQNPREPEKVKSR